MTADKETLLNVEEMLVDLMKTERVYSNDDILKGVRLAWSEVNDKWLLDMADEYETGHDEPDSNGIEEWEDE